MKKKLLLINPISRWIVRPSFPFKRDSLYTPFQPLNLGIIAALTPDHWEVEIFDEIFEPFSYRKADLVGITSYTGSAWRAYQIAQIYKTEGTPVVMGGIHVSQVPEEALKYADSVVTGEAEGVWEKVINDVETGNLQEIYRGELLPMDGCPWPRRDLFRGDGTVIPNTGYLTASIQTTRGCPMDCEFCTVSAFNGRKYRKRPVEEVLDELESIPQQIVFFVDDNFIQKGKEGEERAISLFKGMIERKLDKLWACQTSISVAENEEVLHYAFESGCRLMLMGIESEKEAALFNLGKKINLNNVYRYDEIFKRIHKHKIGIIGTFIFGLDTDSVEDLYDRVKFIKKSRIDVVQPTILTPYPGTKLYERFKESKRLLYTNYPEDWARYDWSNVVYKPAFMDREELKKTMIKCWVSLGNWMTFLFRSIRTIFYTRQWQTVVAVININFMYRMQYYYEKLRD